VQIKTRHYYVRGLQTPSQPFTTLPSGLHSTEIDNISNKCYMHSLTIQNIRILLKAFGFVLNKQEFTDAIALRYNFTIIDSARKCVCGEANTINHALSCKRGGYVSLRHNSLRDMIAELLRTVGCKDVTTEPPLLPVSGVHLPRGSNISDLH
jgi:hypothetical protein